MKIDALTAIFKKYPITCGAYGLAVIMMVVIFATSDLVEDLNNEYNAVIGVEDVLIYNLRNGKGMASQLKGLKDFNESLEHRMLDPSDRTSNYQYFFGLEANAQVKIENPRQLKSVPLDVPAGEQVPGGNQGTVAITEYRINAVGSYGNILKLIFALQSGNYLCRVTDVTLAQSGVIDADALTASVGVSFFGKPDK